jgi:hypothetical protein
MPVGPVAPRMRMFLFSAMAIAIVLGEEMCEDYQILEVLLELMLDVDASLLSLTGRSFKLDYVGGIW